VAEVNEGSTGPHRLPTIREIVEQAGVATSTVRRGLFAPCNANARTPERIERILSELGYVPSAQAPFGPEWTVSPLVPDVTNPFYFGVVRGTHYQLKAAGYAQLLVDTEKVADVEFHALARLRRTADGIILAASPLLTSNSRRRPSTSPRCQSTARRPMRPQYCSIRPRSWSRQSSTSPHWLRGHREVPSSHSDVPTSANLDRPGTPLLASGPSCG
jgi:hypothetical protein